MEIHADIDERKFMIVLFLIICISAVGIVVAYGTSNPAALGHSWGEVNCTGCITNTNLADNSVTGAKIVDQSITSADIVSTGLNADTIDSRHASGTQIWVCECNSGCGYGLYGTYLTNANRNGQLCEVHADVCNVYFSNCQFLGYILAP